MRAETRHQLKQDKLRGVTFQMAESTAHWSVEHKSTILIVSLAAIVLAAGIGGGWYYIQQQDIKASAELSQAVRTLETPLRPAGAPAQPEVPSFASTTERATEARKQFQAIVSKYPRTRTGELARYFSGVTALDLGDYAAAQRELTEVSSSYDADLASLAKLALASVHRKQGNNKEAIQVYKALAEKPSKAVPKATAQLEMAAALMADGQPLEAKRVFELVQKENPASPAGSIAGQKLQDLK